MSEKLGIVGSGLIATGLAVASASAGGDVVIRARSEESVEKAKAAIDKATSRLENPEEIVSAGSSHTTELSDLGGSHVRGGSCQRGLRSQESFAR